MSLTSVMFERRSIVIKMWARGGPSKSFLSGFFKNRYINIWKAMGGCAIMCLQKR